MPAPRLATIAALAAAPVAFTGGWVLLRAAFGAAALPAPGTGDAARALLVLNVLVGAGLLAAALLLARGRAGAWVAGVSLLFGLLALNGAGWLLLRTADWPTVAAGAVALLALLSAPVRGAFLG